MHVVARLSSRLRSSVLSLACVLTVWGAPSARAQEPPVCSGPWQSVGQGMSVHFKQVLGGTDNIWTWCFKNDNARKVVELTFGYSDTKGDHSDLLPFPLDPGKGFGGWASFTSDGKPTRLWIKEIKFKGDEEAKAAGQNAREALNAYREHAQHAIDAFNSGGRRNAALGRAAERARANVAAFEQRYGRQTSVDAAESYYGQLQHEIETADAELDTALTQAESSAGTSTGGASSGTAGAGGRTTGGTSSGRADGGTGPSGGAAPSVTPEEAEAIGDMLGLIFDPSQWGKGPYGGDLMAQMALEDISHSTSYTSDPAADDMKGTSWRVAITKEWAAPRDTVGTIHGPELILDGGQRRATFAPNATGPFSSDRYAYDNVHGALTLSYWLGHFSIGVVGEYQQFKTTAQHLDGTSSAGDWTGQYHKISYGPTVAVGYTSPFVRAKASLFYLIDKMDGTEIDPYGSKATWTPDKSRYSTVGSSLLLSVGILFGQAELRTMNMPLPGVGQILNESVTYGGGIRLPLF